MCDVVCKRKGDNHKFCFLHFVLLIQPVYSEINNQQMNVESTQLASVPLFNVCNHWCECYTDIIKSRMHQLTDCDLHIWNNQIGSIFTFDDSFVIIAINIQMCK